MKSHFERIFFAGLAIASCVFSNSCFSCDEIQQNWTQTKRLFPFPTESEVLDFFLGKGGLNLQNIRLNDTFETKHGKWQVEKIDYGTGTFTEIDLIKFLPEMSCKQYACYEVAFSVIKPTGFYECGAIRLEHIMAEEV